jgi:hypothetical protein
MDDCDLLDTLRAFNERLLIIEDSLGLSMAYIDKLIVDDVLKSREAAKAAEEAKITAFHEAEAEAERVGKSKPIDDFAWRLKAGEFESHRNLRLDQSVLEPYRGD